MTDLLVQHASSDRTEDLILRAVEVRAMIVCADHARAAEIIQQAEEMGLSIPYPLTAGELHTGGYYKEGIEHLVIDDLGSLISIWAGFTVDAVTWTFPGAAAAPSVYPGEYGPVDAIPGPPQDGSST